MKLLLLCLAIVGVFLAIVMGGICSSSEAEQIECQRVVMDSYTNPEEYELGSKNYDRLVKLGVQHKNIGTLAPAQQDCLV